MAQQMFKVIHNVAKKQFQISLGGAKQAKLQYRLIDNIMDMYHTEVPPEYKGHGLGGILAAEAFDYVVENNLKMKLSCSYLQYYAKKNPDPKHASCIVDSDVKL